MDKKEKMTEDQMLNKIKESAKYESIPEELEPEKVEKMLKQYAAGKEYQKNNGENIKNSRERQNTKCKKPMAKKAHNIHFINRYVAAAVAVAFIGVVGLSAWKLQPSAVQPSAVQPSVEYSGNETSVSMEEDETDIQVLGEHIYELAADYGSVYDVLQNTEERYQKNEKQSWFSRVFGAEESVQYEPEITEEVGATSGMHDLAMAPAEEGVNEVVEAVAESAEGTSAGKDMDAFSTTNLQTEGVDESDIIKTDGEYIYQVNGNKVNIYDIRKDKLKLIQTIDVTKSSAADSIREIYLQNDILSVIIERQNTEMKNQQSEDIFSIDTKTVTSVETYDIHERTKPQQIGEYKQDGSYYTSRKKEDIIYLFTGNSIAVPVMERNRAIMEDTADLWLPCINDEVVAADDIYLPKYGNQGMLIGSFSCKNPQKMIDSKMVLNDYAQVYVSQNAIYFYRTNYDGAEMTEIAKFNMKKGKLTAVAAESVKGSILDTFAINEYNDHLRVLTTGSDNGQQSNCVYVLDEKLQFVGQIENLAPGEEIYAARFMGNTGYFVTYRNTDPLFSVDFSNPEEPVVLGELKITGFSEYLHFWGKDKLLGIGYETDPITGEQTGMKLSMFDISNPAKVEECAKLVLENVDYSPALYDYKSVLVNKEENLIGLAVECYGNESDGWKYAVKYLLFGYQDGEFAGLMAQDLDDRADSSEFRGLFAQGKFFLADSDWVAAYERENYTLLKEAGDTDES